MFPAVQKELKLDPAQISRGSTFDALGLDSLDAADLIFTVEDTFGIIVTDQAAQKMKSVGQIVDGIHTLLAERAGTS